MSYEIGNHPARARSGKSGVTSTGKEQIGVEFEFVDGPNKGKRITAYLYFTEKTMERSVESMRIAGFRGGDVSDLSSLSADDTPTVELVLAEEVYEGKTQIKVKWINQFGGPVVGKALEAGQAASFAQKMRGQFAAYDKLGGKRPSPAAKPKPAGEQPSNMDDVPEDTSRPGDLDIPF